MNKPARGLRSDGEATRTRILEAAGELFATTGYAETSNKAIAAQAQVAAAQTQRDLAAADLKRLVTSVVIAEAVESHGASGPRRSVSWLITATASGRKRSSQGREFMRETMSC